MEVAGYWRTSLGHSEGVLSASRPLQGRICSRLATHAQLISSPAPRLLQLVLGYRMEQSLRITRWEKAHAMPPSCFHKQLFTNEVVDPAQVPMGFPQRAAEGAAGQAFVGADALLHAGGFTCPRCKCAVVALVVKLLKEMHSPLPVGPMCVCVCVAFRCVKALIPGPAMLKAACDPEVTMPQSLHDAMSTCGCCAIRRRQQLDHALVLPG